MPGIFIFVIFTTFHTESEKDACHSGRRCNLLLIMDYINESPWNGGITLETAPTIAVLSVNVFLVGFASSLVEFDR